MSPSLALIKKKKKINYLILSTAPLYEFSRASHFFYLQNPRHLPQDVSINRHA